MKLIWAVLCRSSSIDAATNTVSLFHVIEEIEAYPLPSGEIPTGADAATGELAFGASESALPISLELVTLWKRDKDERATRFRVRLLDGATEVGKPNEIEIVWDANLRHRHRLRMAGLPLPAAGNAEYQFSVEMAGKSGKWLPVASIPLIVRTRRP